MHLYSCLCCLYVNIDVKMEDGGEKSCGPRSALTRFSQAFKFCADNSASRSVTGDKAILPLAEEKFREFVCLESTSPFGSVSLPDTTISQLLQGTDRKARGPDRGNLTPPCPLALFWD
jgi:hypothetical protein